MHNYRRGKNKRATSNFFGGCFSTDKYFGGRVWTALAAAPSCINSFDVASMIPAAQCSIFRAIHRADSAASAPHPNVSVWSAEAGDSNGHRMWRKGMQRPALSNKKAKKPNKKSRIMQHPPASDRVGKSQKGAGGGIIPQYSFHSDNKNRKIYTVAPQNRESSTYRF